VEGTRERHRLVLLAVVTTALATIHFADHVIRGELVVDRGLDADWNHSGWPFQPEVNPFDLSVVVVYGVLLAGIVLTIRGRVLAGYWLAASIVLAALALFIHFFHGTQSETPRVIMRSYDNPALGIPALIVLFALLVALACLGGYALRVLLGRHQPSPRS
jgi:hypothetical protein